MLFRSLDKNKFLVMLQNESFKETSIPAGTVIAQLYVADTATVVQSPESQNHNKIDSKLFKFGDAIIPKEWKDRLVKKLSDRANVFSTEEWDVGLAKDVEHHIRLTDDTIQRKITTHSTG